jgi:UDP-N-acetylmuramoyl-L-alanyl-D-glutamate--2,6-diaminopimelate ligase
VADLLASIRPTSVAGDAGVTVSDIVYDSRSARPDTVFVAIRGFNTDGHVHAEAAVKAGCVALVVEEPVPDLAVAQFVVADTREALAVMSAELFERPSEKMSLTGITGTNGKTTTAYFLDSIFRAAGYAAGLIGTVEYRVGDETRPVTRTTPESYDLQKLLKEMTDAGVTHAAMEVSSHAVELKRVTACSFAIKIFTNLSQDHLDFHGDIERYFNTKRLFMEREPGKCILNSDDEYGRRLKEAIPDAITFSLIGRGDYMATDITKTVEGSRFEVMSPFGMFLMKTKMPGDFNVANAIAAAAAAKTLGVGWEAIIRGVAEMKTVPGRFEKIDLAADFTVFVDYAHTPDSLAKAISTAKELAKARVITVFGCGGDRDKEKRPLMGRAAASLSDVAIVTSDNPRSEEPGAIITQVLEGCDGKAIVETDRRAAIKLAIEMAEPGDIVLITGKGHEKEQIMKDGAVEFDDRAVAEEIIKEIRDID